MCGSSLSRMQGGWQIFIFGSGIKVQVSFRYLGSIRADWRAWAQCLGHSRNLKWILSASLGGRLKSFILWCSFRFYRGSLFGP